jgi:glycosyl transferase family 25
MDRIDKFIYINLARREDRRKHIENELKKFEIPEEKIIRLEAIEHERGALGCSMSHLKACEMFKESGDQVWCFLEDDHYFTKTKKETDGYIKQFLDKPEFDVLLGCTGSLKGSDIPNTSFTRAKKSQMTSFFICKNNIIDALIASHKESIRSYGKDGKRKGIPIDVVWHNLMKVFVFVTPYFKPLGAQLENYSDILKKNKKYNNCLNIEVKRKLEEEEK